MKTKENREFCKIQPKNGIFPSGRNQNNWGKKSNIIKQSSNFKKSVGVSDKNSSPHSRERHIKEIHRHSSAAQWVKNVALSLLWLGSLL